MNNTNTKWTKLAEPGRGMRAVVGRHVLVADLTRELKAAGIPVSLHYTAITVPFGQLKAAQGILSRLDAAMLDTEGLL